MHDKYASPVRVETALLEYRKLLPTYLALQVSYSSRTNVFKPGIEFAVELCESTQAFVFGIGKDNKVAGSIFSNEYRLIISVAKFRNFVVSVTKIGTWSNGSHKLTSIIVVLIFYHNIDIKSMDKM